MKLFRLMAAAGLALISGLAFSQQNALNFDGIDDKVTVPNAGQFISGSSQITMTMWVKPMNNVSTFPDYDGFGGFRNNTDADFYIIQLPGNQVEARYRNSTATNFDVLFSPISVGSWQHFAMVYTGTTLQLYYNGVLAGSTPASGVINNASVPFDIGSLLWTGNNFQLLGDMDEVSLWSIALSAQEISCLYTNGIDPASPGLELYYNFNQGTANGNNSGTFTVTNQTGSTNGVLSGFALNGTTSNFVNGVASFITYDSVSICNGSTYVFGSQTLDVSGVYTEAFLSASGCDSLVELTLNVEAVDTSVTEGFGTLTANLTGATYQWIDCGNGNAALPGDTLQTLSQFVTGLPNGFYAVVVTDNGCSDTSACHPLNAAGLFENNANNSFVVSPNPATHEIQFELSKAGNIEIIDITGRVVLSRQNMSAGNQLLPVSSLEPGNYLIRFTSGESQSLGRFIKQ